MIPCNVGFPRLLHHCLCFRRHWLHEFRKGSNSLENRPSTDLLVNLSVLLIFSRSFANKSDSVSVSAFQTSPKIVIVKSALNPSNRACLSPMV